MVVAGEVTQIYLHLAIAMATKSALGETSVPG